MVCLGLNITRDTVDLQRDRSKIFKGEAIAQVDTTNFKLTDEQKGLLVDFDDMKKRSDAKERLKKVELVEGKDAAYDQGRDEKRHQQGQSHPAEGLPGTRSVHG